MTKRLEKSSLQMPFGSGDNGGRTLAPKDLRKEAIYNHFDVIFGVSKSLFTVLIKFGKPHICDRVKRK
jgi:hypothetical protein